MPNSIKTKEQIAKMHDDCRAIKENGRRCSRKVTSRYNLGGGGNVKLRLCGLHNQDRLDGKEINFVGHQGHTAHVSTGAKKKPCTKCGEVKPIDDFSKDSQNEAKGKHEGRACWCRLCSSLKGNDAEKKKRVKERIAKAEKDAEMMAKGKLWCKRCRDGSGSYRLEKFFNIDNNRPSRNNKMRECRDCSLERERERRETPEYFKRQAKVLALKEEREALLAEGKKVCGKTTRKSYGCKRTLPVSDFATNRAYTDGHNEICRSCEKRRKATLKAERPYWYQHLQWVANLRNNYGITQEQWCEMWVEQDGLCAVCHTEGEWHERFHMSALYVDHDHDTGAVRGLLCGKHNTGIGMFDDDMTLLSNSIEYLKKHSA